MLPDFAPRATGKTTRVLLSIALALSNGERVLLIAPQLVQGRALLEQLHRLLVTLGAERFISRQGNRLECWRGIVEVASSDTLENQVKGKTFTRYFTDGGVLDQQESDEVYMHVSDVTYFETEYDQPDLFGSSDEPRPRNLSSRE